MGQILAELQGFYPNTIMIFGVLLLAGVAGGMIANRIKWMPTITAFMLLGIVIGPHGLGLVTKPMLTGASVLVDIALGLILYRLGNMLHPRAMLKSKKLMLTSGLEIAFTFLLSFFFVRLMGLGDVMAALIAAICVSSSPAVLVHVSEELLAGGPVTERAKSLVALNNLFSFMIFSIALPFALVTQDDSTIADVILVPLYRLMGAAAIGIAVGWVAIRITRMLGAHDEHYRFAIVIGAVMMALGLSDALSVSSLFAPLVLGVATRGFETSKANLTRVGLGEGGDLFFIALFVIAGAKIDLPSLLHVGVIPLLLAAVRAVGIFAGMMTADRLAGVERTQTTATSLLLVPMAGMAIGLVATTNDLVPDMGGQLATIVYAMVALFETIGPFAAHHAFRMAGEIGANDKEKPANLPGSESQAVE